MLRMHLHYMDEYAVVYNLIVMNKFYFKILASNSARQIKKKIRIRFFRIAHLYQILLCVWLYVIVQGDTVSAPQSVVQQFVPRTAADSHPCQKSQNMT